MAIVSDASAHVGPHLARLLARQDHDLVVGDPVDSLTDELKADGADRGDVEVVPETDVLVGDVDILHVLATLNP